MAGYFGLENKEVIRIKVKKCDGLVQPEYKKFSIDPQITSFEMLQGILAKAFNIKSDFSTSYLAKASDGQKIYLSMLSDWDMDAACQCASEPYLKLKVDLKPFEEGLEDWDIITPGDIPQLKVTASMFEKNSFLGALTGSISSQMEKTLSHVQKVMGLKSYEDSAVKALKPAMTDMEFHNYLDGNGHLIRPQELRLSIYQGGIEPSLRKVVWRHLLNIFPDNMSGRERYDYLKQKEQEYYKVRKQWKSHLETDTASDEIKNIISVVKKDVLRTDRTYKFYAGSDDSNNILSLIHILVTYAVTHPDISYCQGMSDLASPLLVVQKDESHAYLCFCGLMKHMKINFHPSGQAMKVKLQHLSMLLQLYDPVFYNYLCESSPNHLFCFRWLLLELKREFPLDDALYMLEVMWSTLPPDPPATGLELTDPHYSPSLISSSPSSPTLSFPQNMYANFLALRLKGATKARNNGQPDMDKAADSESGDSSVVHLNGIKKTNCINIQANHHDVSPMEESCSGGDFPAMEDATARMMHARSCSIDKSLCSSPPPPLHTRSQQHHLQQRSRSHTDGLSHGCSDVFTFEAFPVTTTTTSAGAVDGITLSSSASFSSTFSRARGHTGSSGAGGGKMGGVELAREASSLEDTQFHLSLDSLVGKTKNPPRAPQAVPHGDSSTTTTTITTTTNNNAAAATTTTTTISSSSLHSPPSSSLHSTTAISAATTAATATLSKEEEEEEEKDELKNKTKVKHKPTAATPTAATTTPATTPTPATITQLGLGGGGSGCGPLRPNNNNNNTPVVTLTSPNCDKTLVACCGGGGEDGVAMTTTLSQPPPPPPPSSLTTTTTTTTDHHHQPQQQQSRPAAAAAAAVARNSSSSSSPPSLSLAATAAVAAGADSHHHHHHQHGHPPPPHHPDHHQQQQHNQQQHHHHHHHNPPLPLSLPLTLPPLTTTTAAHSPSSSSSSASSSQMVTPSESPTTDSTTTTATTSASDKPFPPPTLPLPPLPSSSSTTTTTTSSATTSSSSSSFSSSTLSSPLSSPPLPPPVLTHFAASTPTSLPLLLPPLPPPPPTVNGSVSPTTNNHHANTTTTTTNNNTNTTTTTNNNTVNTTITTTTTNNTNNITNSTTNNTTTTTTTNTTTITTNNTTNNTTTTTPTTPTPPGGGDAMLDRSQRLPPPQDFGAGNPFLMFLCLTILLQHRDLIINKRLECEEIDMYFQRLTRKQNVHKVLHQARTLYSEYLRNQQKLEDEFKSFEEDSLSI